MRMKKEHAFRVVQETTEQVVSQLKSRFDAKALGRLGGLKGGKARAEKLSPERRKEIAKKAAMARWGK